MLFKKIRLLFIFLALCSNNSYSQQYDAEVVNFETNIQVNLKKLTTIYKILIKVNNRNGEKYTKMALPYSKLIKISKIEASIIAMDHSIIKKLQKDDIIEKSAISGYSFYEDNFIKEFTLKHTYYPYFFECTYQTEEKDFLQIENWYPIIDTDIPTTEAKLTIETPIDYKIRYLSQFTNSFKTDTLTKSITYEWNASYSKIIHDEILSPEIKLFLPRVLVVPLNFNFEIQGSFNDWISFGNWNYELTTGLSELPDKEKYAIDSELKGIDDPKLKVKRLYEYVQNQTRYVNISIETGGFKPYPASYVSANKYGDCKALSNYFKSVLEYAGIPSFYTKIYAGEPINAINQKVPYQQFNHIILCVPLAKDTLWLDATSDNPFAYIGTFIQNRPVFVVKKDASFFNKTPALKASEVQETRVGLIKLVNKKMITVEMTRTERGQTFESLKNIVSNYNQTRQNQIIREHFIESGLEIDTLHIEPPDKDSSSIQLYYRGKTNRHVNFFEKDVNINFIPFDFPKFEKPENRMLPVQIDLPTTKIDTLIYQIPKGFKVLHHVNPVLIENEFGCYSMKSVENKDEIVIIKKFVLNSGLIEKEKYQPFYQFITEIDKIERKTNVIFTEN